MKKEKKLVGQRWEKPLKMNSRFANPSQPIRIRSPHTMSSGSHNSRKFAWNPYRWRKEIVQNGEAGDKTINGGSEEGRRKRGYRRRRRRKKTRTTVFKLGLMSYRMKWKVKTALIQNLINEKEGRTRGEERDRERERLCEKGKNPMF